MGGIFVCLLCLFVDLFVCLFVLERGRWIRKREVCFGVGLCVGKWEGLLLLLFWLWGKVTGWMNGWDGMGWVHHHLTGKKNVGDFVEDAKPTPPFFFSLSSL